MEKPIKWDKNGLAFARDRSGGVWATLPALKGRWAPIEATTVARISRKIGACEHNAVEAEYGELIQI